MDDETTQLGVESATRVIRKVLGVAPYPTALIALPVWMGPTAESLARALRELGSQVQLSLLPAPTPATMSVEDCADRWVPRDPGESALIVLSGVRPWSDNVEGDHWIEIEAMQRREALLSEGRRLLFIDWPRGARRDAEIDLRPDEMARLYRRAYDIDYDLMRQWNAQLHARVSGTSRVHITCPAGSDVTLSIAGRRWLNEDCVLGNSEPAVYLPGGEIYVPVQEESAEGRVLFHHVGTPRIATFERGRLMRVERLNGEVDRELASEMGVGSEPLCELGIGTNPWAPPWQVGTLYEKSAGTVHVAVGGNAHFGGMHESPRHMDLIIRAPSLSIDGEKVTLPEGLWGTKEPS